MKFDVIHFQNQVDKWIKTHGVRYFDLSTNMIQLSEEVGEVGRIIARGYGEQSQKESDKKKDLSEELCDVLFVCLCIANQTEAELLGTFQKKEEDLKKQYSKDILNLMINLIIETGKVAQVVINRNDKVAKESNENLEEHLSNLLIYLLNMAEQTQIDLPARFIKRLEEKAKRDHNRNWNNKKLL